MVRAAGVWRSARLSYSLQVDEQAPPKSDPPPVYTPRRSRCMDAAKARERERIMAMTSLERMELALALGRRCQALRTAQADK